MNAGAATESCSFARWEPQLEDLHARYAGAEPFPSIVLDDFLDAAAVERDDDSDPAPLRLARRDALAFVPDDEVNPVYDQLLPGLDEHWFGEPVVAPSCLEPEHAGGEAGEDEGAVGFADGALLRERLGPDVAPCAVVLPAMDGD